MTRKQEDIASFKTPGLRNVLVTGPYFHDGSMQTLWDVMDHYNKGDGITDPWLDKDMQPLALTEPEIERRGGVSCLADKPAIQGNGAGVCTAIRCYPKWAAHSGIRRGLPASQPKQPPLPRSNGYSPRLPSTLAIGAGHVGKSRFTADKLQARSEGKNCQWHLRRELRSRLVSSLARSVF